jgi:hypothetical protein
MPNPDEKQPARPSPVMDAIFPNGGTNPLAPAQKPGTVADRKTKPAAGMVTK